MKRSLSIWIISIFLSLGLFTCAFGQPGGGISPPSVPVRVPDCSTYTNQGQLCYDTDDNKLYAGNGTTAVEIPVLPGGSLTLSATLGTELAPALTGASGVNWTFAGTYTTPLNSTIEKAGDGTDTITPTAATTIVAGTTYKIVITTSAFTVSSLTYTLGSITGTTISTATTTTDYITATTTGKLIITPTVTGARFVISAVSIKALGAATGDLTIDGNLTVHSPATFDGGVTVNHGQVLFPAGSVAAPSLLIGDSDTGFANLDVGEGAISLIQNGVLGIFIRAIGLQIGTKYIAWGGDAYNPDLYLYRQAANSLQVGEDAATATAQTIKGPDSTGAGIAGGPFNLAGGTGGAGGAVGYVGVATPLAYTVQTVTIATSGDANHATGTITPTTSYVNLVCNDDNPGCTVSLSETGAVDGQIVTIINTSANHCDFADQGGVLNIIGSAYVMAQGETLTLQYATNQWQEIARATSTWTGITVGGFTASRAVYSNAAGELTAHATLTDTELGYVDGVTSAIQDQLNGKMASAGTGLVERIGVTFDGGGSVILVNKIAYTHVPFAVTTINSWVVQCDIDSGTTGIIITPYLDAYAEDTHPTTTMCTTGTPPHTSDGATAGGMVHKANWDCNITAIPADSMIMFKVTTAPTSSTWCSVTLKVTR